MFNMFNYMGVFFSVFFSFFGVMFGFLVGFLSGVMLFGVGVLLGEMCRDYMNGSCMKVEIDCKFIYLS